jgi:thioredoxin 1
MLELSDQNFEQEVLEADLPVFVDFYASWCPPCKMAAPVIEELAGEYQETVKFGKLDIDKGKETASKYGIMSVPTIVVFKGGEEVERLVGFPGKKGYKKLIEHVIK